MSTLGTNYGISELRIALALEDAINNYLVNGTMPNEGTLYGISEKRLAIAIAENTSIGGAGGTATWGGINGTLSNQTDLATALSLKQNSLISGTNIKTINSNSLLGSGDLSVVTSPAGSSGQIQFNNVGLFGASSNFVWDNTNNRLGVNITPTSTFHVKGSAKFEHSTSANPGGILIRDFQSGNGGWSNLEIAGPNFGIGTGLLFFNNSSQVHVTDFYVINQFATATGIFGPSAIGVPDNQVRITSDANNSYIWSLKYASSPYPPLILSSPSFNFQTKSGAVWPDNVNYGTSALFIDGSQRIGINNLSPSSQLDVINNNSSQVVFSVKGSSGQVSDIQQWVNNSGSVIGAIKADGSYQPASLTDAASTNNSAYFSSTTSRLTYKNSSGVLSSFSGINTGDQSSIVGITGTTTQFNTALTDGDFTTLAGTETLTNKVIVRKLSTKTGNYTLTNADGFVRFNGTNLTATLPDATTLSGYEFEIKNVNATNLTVDTTSAQLIDANLTVTLTQYEALKIVSNGTSWDVI